MIEPLRSDEEVDVNEKVIRDINSFFLDLLAPNDYSDGIENVVIGYETSFQDMCAAIESIGASTEGLTVLQLYAKLNYYKQSNGNSKDV